MEEHAKEERKEEDETKGKYVLKQLKIPCVYYKENFLGETRGNKMMEALIHDMEAQWHSVDIKEKTNRYTILYGDTGVKYIYSARDQPSTIVTPPPHP